MHIHGENNAVIRIIPQTRFHADEMFQVLNDPRLCAFTDDSPPPTRDWLFERYAKLETRTSPTGEQLWLNWVVQDIASNSLVGYAQATVEQSKADVAWVIGTNQQGNGFATQAGKLLLEQLAGLGVAAATCHIKKTNKKSIRVARKLGFVNTGTIEDGELVYTLTLTHKKAERENK